VSPASASLRPVAGGVAEISELLAYWLEPGDAHRAGAPLLVRSSGSTGTPKDVALSADAMRFSAAASLSRLGGPGQWVLALPVTYVAGLQVLTRSWLAGTAPVALEEHRDLASAVCALGTDRRYLAAVPTQLHRWLASAADTEALRHFDAVLLGGAAAGAELLGGARGRGVRVVTSYGMTETCGGCVYDGVPLDGVAVALGTGGEVRLAGPMLFEGYDGRPELTAEVLRGGWLHTPDLGRFDVDGRLELLGRADDVVMSGGVSVPLAAVERRIAALPDVDAVAVVAVPDDEWGSALVAVVAAVPGRLPPPLEEVRDFVGAAHPRSWAPRQLVQRDALPLLSSGKIDRRALALELAERRRPSAASRTHSSGSGPAGRSATGGVSRERRQRTPHWSSSVFSLPMNVRFRGLTHREGVLLYGRAGVGEFSPFWGYGIEESAQWLAAALEAADEGFPEPLRDYVPVNCTVPAVSPDQATAIVTGSSGCRTAKVKVAERGQSLDDDLARVAAVRQALGPEGHLRVDANGGWTVSQAVEAIAKLAEFDLEYVEQPVGGVEELALVRRQVDVPVAADESIRRADDPYRVRDLEAADIAVLKVQPLGGVSACLRIAEEIAMPVVVSSALESSVGLAAGLALAAALPELPYACGLATASMLTRDVTRGPLVPIDGHLAVRAVEPDAALVESARADPATEQRWLERLEQCQRVLAARGR